MTEKKKGSAWSWVPSLYYAQGIPYVVVMTVSVIMYKRLGVSNTEIALYTSWLYLPWVIKPLWSPLVDLFRTKRWWIISMQLLVGAGLAGVALTIPMPSFFQYSLAFLWLLAFSSATHDIAADGFYMIGLPQGQQSYFIGIRSTFYRFAMITGQGLLIILAGFFEVFTGQEPLRFQVEANPGAPARYVYEAVLPDASAGEKAQDLFFISPAEPIRLPATVMDSALADSLLQLARGHNRLHGFVAPEASQVLADVRSSWFSARVSQPLASWLKRRFGQNDPEEGLLARRGQMALVGIRLSGTITSERELVLNTRFQRGDASIRLIEGERLVFTPENQHEQAWMVVQLDPKLDRAALATFDGRSGNIPLAWSMTFFILAALFFCFFVYHRFILPRPAADQAVAQGTSPFVEFFRTFASFFRKKQIGVAMTFFLVFRLGEAQLVKMASPFMLDPRDLGGLGLTTGDVGLVYGTIGILALTLGGILGGLMASRHGLKYWLLPMTLAINIPNLVYVYLSWAAPENLWLISGAVALEQFGYGFGFTAYMLYMIYFAEGTHKTAHFAICTGLMALGMMLPGMFSGWLQEIIGYQSFFVWVMICTIPGFLIIRFLKIDREFGVKKETSA